MVNNGEVVFLQVSGGSEDILKPGLNIIGGMQPRGLREFIPGISGISDEVGEVEWSIDMVEDDPDVAELMGVSMVMSCTSLRFIMSMPGMLDMSDILDVAVDRPGTAAEFVGSIPSPGPASRTLWGRHWTLPLPLAKILSTQAGKAPVLRYRANTTSESSCVQSFRRMFVASRSASWSAAASPRFRASDANGRWRDAAGRMRSGPRMASL